MGETWGLFWPDTELEDKSEDPNKYIKVMVVVSVSEDQSVICRNIMKTKTKRRTTPLLMTAPPRPL